MTDSPITGPLDPSNTEAAGGALQATLAELIDVSLIGKQAHWNVVGPNFRSVHQQLDELVATARSYTDKVAERTSALGVPPEGTATTVTRHSGLAEYPGGWRSDTETVETITSILATLIARVRDRIEQTDKTDLVTQDLLIELAQQLEQAHWMWQAQQA